MSLDEERILRELQQSILFSPGFPQRVRHSFEKETAHSKRAEGAADRPELQAIRLARDSWRHLEEVVRQLGAARYEPAIPTLARLWRECALVPVRARAGHALFAMGTEDARSALESMIEDNDFMSLFLGVRAVFDRDPSRAYEYFEHRFTDGNAVSAAVGRQALALFSPSTYSMKEGRLGPNWTEALAPLWLRQDPRWTHLCARLRHHEVFGEAAREVLRHADAGARTLALEAARQIEPPKKIERRVEKAGNLLARYKSGQCSAVWRDIRSHSNIAGEFRDEVFEVAEETMRRVARNADIVSERLEIAGWRSLGGKLRTKPSPDDVAVFQRIEQLTGSPVPPSLLAFWIVVGGIDWVWDYESKEIPPDLGVDVPMDRMDPLCVDSASAIKYLFKEWEGQRDQPDPDLVDPFRLDLAPDLLHKANISGGLPYAVVLPFFGADPPFAFERHELSFVDYLRMALQWAGFPGLDQHADREDVQRFVRDYGQGLEPF